MSEESSVNGRGPFDLSLLTAQEQQVGQFAAREPLKFATSSIADIADWTATSQATVIRTARKLGFSGAKEMKAVCAAIVEESRNLPGIIKSRLVSLPSSEAVTAPGKVAQTVAADAADLILKLGRDLEPRLIAAVITAVEKSERVVIYGLGTAFNIAEYAALELERIGFSAVALTGSGHMNADNLMRLHRNDALFILAPRMIFPDIQTFLEHAVARTAHTIVISQEFPATTLSAPPIHLALPGTVATSATESVAAWILMDIIVAELARRFPDRAVQTRTEIQRYREILSGRRGRKQKQ